MFVRSALDLIIFKQLETLQRNWNWLRINEMKLQMQKEVGKSEVRKMISFKTKFKTFCGA